MVREVPLVFPRLLKYTHGIGKLKICSCGANKILDDVFLISKIIKDKVRVVSLITHPMTMINLDVRKTESNNNLIIIVSLTTTEWKKNLQT